MIPLPSGKDENDGANQPIEGKRMLCCDPFDSKKRYALIILLVGTYLTATSPEPT